MSSSGLDIDFNHASVFGESGHVANPMQNEGVDPFFSFEPILSYKIGSSVIRLLQ